MGGDETKATFTVDLSPVVDLVQGVRDDVRDLRHEVSESVREVRDDVGTLSQKVADISVDHTQRITRTEDRADVADHRMTALETKHEVLAGRVAVLETAEVEDGAVAKVRGRQHTNWQWRITTGIGTVMGLSGWAVLIYYLVGK